MRIRQALLLAACCCTMLRAQVATDANTRYQTVEGRKAVAANLGNPERDATERPQELVDEMALTPGMTVADIGTGVGYMLPYLSRAVGPSGRVLAEDIFDDFLSAAKKRAADQKLGNVQFIKGTETDPHLGDRSVDVILALDSYHHYDYPEKMLAAFARALRDGGRLVVVEYYKRPNAMPGGDAVKHIRLDEPDLVREIESHGFRKVSEREHIKGSQYMAVFESKREHSAMTLPAPAWVAHAFVDAINHRSPEEIASLMTEDHVFIDSLGARVTGRQQMKTGWQGYFGMVPDYAIEVEETFAEGPVVVMFGAARGTWASGGSLKPENKWETPAAWRAVVRGESIAEWRVYADNEPIRKIMARDRQ